MRFFIISHICVLLSCAAGAQVQINSIETLIRYADKNSPYARQAALQPAIAKQDLNIQASGIYPRVNAFASGDYYPIIATQVIPAEVLGGPKGTYLKAQFGLPYVFATGIELSMPIVNLEKWTQLSRVRAQYRQSEWSSRLALENLHMQLIQSYYQLLVAREVAALNAGNVTTGNEMLTIMEERHKTGILNPSDYNRAKNLQSDTRAAAINYERSIRQLTSNLKALLGIGDDTLWIADSLATFRWKLPAGAGDVKKRPAWQESNAKTEIAELALKEGKRAALPKLNLNGRYAYNMQTKFENGNNVEFDASNVGLRLDVPVFQGNYYRSVRRKNALLLESAKTDQERITAQVRQQQQDWYDQYQAAFDKHTLAEQKLASASDNLRIARLSLAEGVMEFDEFNNIFMEYSRARMEYIQNLADGILYYLLSTQNF